MLFLVRTHVKRYLDLLLFGIFVVILAVSILGMNKVDVRSLDISNSGSPSQVPSNMPSTFPSQLPSNMPIYLPAVQR